MGGIWGTVYGDVQHANQIHRKYALPSSDTRGASKNCSFSEVNSPVLSLPRPETTPDPQKDWSEAERDTLEKQGE